MFNTKHGLEQLNKRIFQAQGKVKINEGNGFMMVTIPQLDRVLHGLRLKAYKVIGYTEKCKGAIPYELSLAISLANR